MPNKDDVKPTSFEDEMEKKIREKELLAPRVTKAQIDLLYKRVEFIHGKVSETRIMCTAMLDGFAIADGFSACIDARNFDEEIGLKISHKNCALKAYDKLWELEGYRLSRSLVEAAKKQS